VPHADLVRIAELAKKFDFYVISDEIYSQLTYTDSFSSMLSLPGMASRTIVVDGFSKSWSMTGWRLGWAVMPRELAGRVELLMVHSVGCTAAFSQAAGLAALDGPTSDIEQMREEYRLRRDLVVRELNEIDGVTCRVPDGAFYAWADISSFGLSSRAVAERLLRDGFVAVLPGTDFGAGGEGYIRISYGTQQQCFSRHDMYS
jgi:aspartate/methionine/tyrosine aminotransferase